MLYHLSWIKSRLRLRFIEWQLNGWLVTPSLSRYPELSRDYHIFHAYFRLLRKERSTQIVPMVTWRRTSVLYIYDIYLHDRYTTRHKSADWSVSPFSNFMNLVIFVAGMTKPVHANAKTAHSCHFKLHTERMIPQIEENWQFFTLIRP